MGKRVQPRIYEQLPDWYEVPIPKATAEHCLFWQRSEGDALAILSGLALIKGEVCVRHVLAACALLDRLPDDGAKRLCRRLRRLTITTSEEVVNRIDTLPANVERRERLDHKGQPVRYGCSYLIDPKGGIRCSRTGQYRIENARGTFCIHHIKRAVAQKARRDAHKKPSAQPPAP